MQLDYQSPYQHDYLGHAPGAKPFSDGLPPIVQSLFAQLGCRSLLDVGSGSEELLRILRTYGINCIGADLRPNPEMGIVQFDLSIRNSTEVIQSISEKLPYTARPSLLTCFDMLEHIGRAHLSRALWNLRSLCNEWFFTSVDTRPSSKYNAYHTTLIPRSTWLILFDALGFSVEENSCIAPLHIPVDNSEASSPWCLHHWRQLNPYKDSHSCESHYVLLRKREEPSLSFEAFDRTVSRILGVVSSAANSSIHSETFISFLLGHYQEFLIFEPFFNVLPKDSFRVLMRSGPYEAIEAHRRQSLLSYFDARGIAYERVESVGELSWVSPTSPRPNHALVTAIDSTAAHSHLVNSAIVLEARRNGLPTFQLQHGLWPHAEYPGGMTVMADYLLTWSPDFERPFLLETQTQEQKETPEHLSTSQGARHTVLNVGSPRFGTYCGGETATIVELFGDWARKYTSSVLVATNLHWPLHARGSAVLPQLCRTAAEMPDTLFICKLHPAHDYEPSAFASMPENVIVIDEFISLYADLSIPRLIKACDAVVCTQSTVALEAAIAHRPLLVLDTENPNHYEGIAVSEIEQLTNSVRAMLNTGETDHHHFLEVYYSAPDQSNALSNVLEAITNSFRAKRPRTSGRDIAEAAFARSFLLEIAARHRA